jgi:uncharacterized protein
MDVEWDQAKKDRNLAKHGVDFVVIEGFNWEIAVTREDTRVEYDETRYVSISAIGDRLFVAVWTERGAVCRLISLRKANKREVANYARS